jgi:transitional endoplasmic reticulum ATPase
MRFARPHRLDPRGQGEILSRVLLLVSAAVSDKGETQELTSAGVGSRLRRRLRAIEKQGEPATWLEGLQPNLQSSLSSMQELLVLDDTELRCLAFLILLNSYDRLRAAAGMLGCELNDHEATDSIAAAIGLPVPEVEAALSGQGRLMGSQLIRREHEHAELGLKFRWVTQAFPQEMMQSGFDPLRALRDRVIKAPPPTLAWSQFAHLGDFPRVALGYVRQCLASRKRGVNLLLHGAPGVGKTEFARTFARELGCDLFEVSSEDMEGDPIEPAGRLQALRVLHGFCTGRRCLLVFDECEDVFPRPNPFMGPSLSRAKPKAWLNRMLESNASASIWLTNSVEGIDAAFIRRFDLVMEVTNPPAGVRESQLRALSLGLPESVIRSLGSCEDLTPAVVQRAAAVVSVVHHEQPGVGASELLIGVINQTLLAQGHRELPDIRSDAVYDPEFLHLDLDPRALLEGLKSNPVGRLCFHGPPGTGKTAFGRWLAEGLGRRAVTKRASDLLGPYVGMTERSIARAFREADSRDTVLLIDEADSFLQDRRHTSHGWEVTQVNEFLTQLEQCEGLVIATTNRVEHLDHAALRRFDLKLRFDYLRPEQSRRLLATHLEAAVVPAATSADLRNLDQLCRLTPGDFAAVARQHRFRPLRDASAWVDCLRSEVNLKPSMSSPALGFYAWSGDVQAP